jgi:tetratricopeptide (TPR) repeat protein
MLTPAQFRQIVDLCAPHMQTSAERRAILSETFAQAPFQNDINWEGATSAYVPHLLRVLLKVHRYDGEHPLRTLLTHLKTRYSPDLHPHIDSLLPGVDALPPDAQFPDLPHTVFLSYARADDETFVRLLYNDLTRHGLNVWYDRVSMPNRGLGFTQEIAHAIEQADRLLLVCGPKAYQSEYVRMEWQHALAHCVPIIPVVRLGDFPPPILSQLGANALDAVDMRDDNHRAERLDYLSRQILSSTLPLAPLTNVPIVESWYLERDAKRREVIRALTALGRENTVAICAINGLGGVGKTVLAALVARDCETRRTFPDGIAFIEIGKKPDLLSRQAEFGALFGMRPDQFKGDLAVNKALLRQAIGSRKLLIILDNVWSRDAVDALQCGADGVKFVVTTRLVNLAGALGRAVRVDTLTPEEGGELILKRADLKDDQRAACEAISRHLKGLTLAVRIAADKIRNDGLAPAAYLERLKQADNPLEHLTLADPDDPYADENRPDANLAASLNLTYGDLNEAMARRFRLLGAFAPESTFDAAAAAAIWEEPVEEATQKLNILVNLALAERDERGRYSQHSLLRAYARALARERGELDAAAARHANYYLTRHNYGKARDFTPHAEEIAPDFENIQAALFWGFEHAVDRACAFAVALDGGYMAFHKPYPVRRQLLEAAQRAEGQSDLSQANTLRSLGDLAMLEDNYGAARERYGAALRLFEAIPDRLGQANTLRSLGDLERLEANYGAARERYGVALRLYEAIPDRLGQANTLQSLGDLERLEANYGAARERYGVALRLYEAIPDRLGQAHTLQSLGDLAMREANYGAARERYGAALRLYEAIPDRLGQAHTLQSLGDLAMREANYGAARERYGVALRLYEAIPDRLGQANTLRSLGDLERLEANYGAARERYGAALRLYEAIPNRLGQANTLKSLGDLAMLEDNYGAARERYGAALRLYEAIPNRLGQAHTLKSLGDLAMLEDNYGAARERYGAALRLFEAIPDRLGQAHTLKSLGDLAMLEDNYGAARERYGAALRLYEAIPDRLGQAHTLRSLGDLAMREDNYGAARERYNQALALARQIPDTVCQLNCLIGLARLERAQGNREAACAQYAALFRLTDSLPAFANHPTVQDWKREAAEYCDGRSVAGA